MQMNKYLMFGIGFILLIWLMSVFTGLAMFGITTMLTAVLVLALFQKFKVFRLLPISTKHENIAIILIIVAMFFTGSIGTLLSGLGVPIPDLSEGVPSGEILPDDGPTSQEVTGCAASVSDYIRGSQATATVNAYDQASDTPLSSAVDGTIYIIDSSGGVTKSTDTSDYSMNKYSVGDTVSIKGGDSSYYIVPTGALCIDREAFPIDIDAYAVASYSDLEISGYDDTGSSTLSAGTNTSEEDYDITLGANEESTYYLKLKQNTANKAFNLYAVGTSVFNDIDESEPLDGVWTKVTTPKFLKGLELDISDGHGEDNATDVDFTTWTLDEPILLEEWDSVKYQFNIVAGSTNPTTNTVASSSDMAIVCFFDAIHGRGDDGMYMDFYSHDNDESDVGMSNHHLLPIGKNDCTVIEGI